MSRAKAGLLNVYWQALHDLNEFTGRNVTAGELAGEMEVSRNTAKKKLELLASYHAAGSIVTMGKNHQPMTLYYAINSEAE